MMSVSSAVVKRASEALVFGAKENEQVKSLDATISTIDANVLTEMENRSNSNFAAKEP
jgi:hypothetical protein